MAVGKNKVLMKGDKMGDKKKNVVDPFSKKDLYGVKAPAMTYIRNVGKTPVMRTQGIKIASDGLKGHVFEVSLADVQNDEVAFRKFKLITEDVQGKNCLTDFLDIDLTHDKMRSMVKKWQTMTEAVLMSRQPMGIFFVHSVLVLLKKHNNQIHKTSYAQHQQEEEDGNHDLRGAKDLTEVINKLLPDNIGKDIEKACQFIYLIHDVFVRKVKVLKKPHVWIGKTLEASW